MVYNGFLFYMKGLITLRFPLSFRLLLLRRLSLLQPRPLSVDANFQFSPIQFLLLNLISFHCHHVIIYTDSKWWLNNQGFSSINPLTRMKLMRNEESDALRSTSTKETTIINGVETKPNGKFSDRKQTQLTYQWYDKWKEEDEHHPSISFLFHVSAAA